MKIRMFLATMALVVLMSQACFAASSPLTQDRSESPSVYNERLEPAVPVNLSPFIEEISGANKIVLIIDTKTGETVYLRMDGFGGIVESFVGNPEEVMNNIDLDKEVEE